MTRTIASAAAACLVASAGADFGGGMSRTAARALREQRDIPGPTDPETETRQMRRAREREQAKSPMRWLR